MKYLTPHIHVRYCLLLLLCLAASRISYGQNSVGIGTETPNPWAVLHLVSPGKNQGLLVPVMTTSERTADGFIANLSSSENGLLVFDSEENTLYYWVNDQWMAVASGTVGGDVSGPLADLQINSGAVSLENMADSSVASSTIVDNSITTTDIQSPGANKVLISTNAGTVFWENLNIFGTVRLDEGFIYVGSARNEPVQVAISGDITLESNGVAEITNEAILNEDISQAAGIVVAKLQSMPVGSIIYGNVEGVATVGTVSGDATINEAGQVVLTNSPATRSNLGLDQASVAITGGTINATALGNEVPSTGSFTQISGDGSGITNLAASNITSGELAVDRLPTLTPVATIYGDPNQNNPITSITVDTKGRVTNASVGTPSDRRLKKDWVALRHSWEKLRQITPYTYYWKKGDAQQQVGVMAQEVEKVFPELVHTRNDGYKTVNYPGLIPPLLNVVQEQQQTIDALKERLLAQERENKAMHKELREIRQMLEQGKK